MDQGDSNGNGIGDMCECYADCDNDTQVGLFDLSLMKNEFGRNNCSTILCNADCNDDGDVGLFDLTIMKVQFGWSECPVVE
jgi:hypothetical protein